MLELDTLPRTARLPVLFVGHGSPLNVITDSPWRRQWQALGPVLRAQAAPRLVLCVSAHWMTHGWWLTAMAQPQTIHDFGGFPQALFDVQYPAPGWPEAARAIAHAVALPGSEQPLGLDEGEWGLDHGCWGVLQPMFPEADIPVIQLSVDPGRSGADHLALGRRLAVLRERGVLIVASGNVVHNLRALRREVPDNQAYEWAIGFDQTVAEALSAGQPARLADWAALGETAALSHPSPEHWLPLMVAAGAAGEGAVPEYFNEGFQAASIGMRSMVWA